MAEKQSGSIGSGSMAGGIGSGSMSGWKPAAAEGLSSAEQLALKANMTSELKQAIVDSNGLMELLRGQRDKTPPAALDAIKTIGVRLATIQQQLDKFFATK